MMTLTKTADHEFPREVEKFIKENFEPSPALRNLADVIAWNEEHSEQALPERKLSKIESQLQVTDIMM